MRDDDDDRISADSYLEHDKDAFESTMIERPEGSKWFKLDSAKTRYIDVIPYTVGEGNPMADKGSRYFVRNYWAHRGIGPDGRGSEICHAATFGKPCAVCTEADRLLAEGDIDLETHKKLKRPSKRQLYHVVDTQDPDGAVQLWDVSHFFFGKALNDALKAAAEDEEDSDYKFFASLKGGYTLKLLIEEEKFQGRATFKVKRIDFKPRKKNYSRKILEQTHCLDDLIKRRSYEEIKAAFLQTANESVDDSSTSSTRKGNRDMAKKKVATKAAKETKSAPEKKTTGKPATKVAKAPKATFNKGDKVDADDLGICKVLKVSDDGKKLALKDSDGEIHRNVSVLDVSPIAEKPAKAAPKKKAKPAPKKKAAPPVEEEEEDSELEDEDDDTDEEDSELEDEDDEEDSELEDEEDSELEDEEDEDDSELEDEDDSELEDEEDSELEDDEDDEDDSELEDDED